MVAKIKYIWPILLLSACVEIFEFNTSSEDKAVILEAEISDVSALDYFAEFDELRFFEVKLKWASIVKNVRDEVISGAEVELSANGVEFWDYVETEPGVYQLMYPDLKAEPGVQYQLTVTLPDGSVITSNLETLPSQSREGELKYVEKSEPMYVVQSGENVIDEVYGVELYMEMPEPVSEDEEYYRWDFTTTWVLKADQAKVPDPAYLTCWVTEELYYDEYRILQLKGKPARESMFFLPTEGNLFIRDGFAVVIRQTSLSTGQFNFWEDLQRQGEQSELFAPPPYNLQSNLQISADDLDVYGYFGVTREHNYTWYFDWKDMDKLPTFSDPCNPVVPKDDFPFYCSNCMLYERIKFGDKITNIQPRWWRP